MKKNSKIIYKILVLALLFAIFCMATACGIQQRGKDNKLPLQYEIAFAQGIEGGFPFNSDTLIASIAGYDFEVVVDSVNKIQEMNERYGGAFFGEESEYYNSDLSKKIRSYNEEFFKEKEILYVARTLSHYETRSLKSVDLVDDELVVTIQKPIYSEGDAFADVITTYIFLIELDKSVGVRDIKVNTVEVDK